MITINYLYILNTKCCVVVSSGVVNKNFKRSAIVIFIPRSQNSTLVVKNESLFCNQGSHIKHYSLYFFKLKLINQLFKTTRLETIWGLDSNSEP